MIIRLFASDENMREQLITLAKKSLAHENIEGEVFIVTQEQNKNLYKFEIDPTILIDEELVIEKFIPTEKELAQVIRMQKDGEYKKDHECAHGGCGSDDQNNDVCCTWCHY